MNSQAELDVEALDFDDVFKLSKMTDVEGLKVRQIHPNHLIRAESIIRPKDQDDLLHLSDY